MVGNAEVGGGSSGAALLLGWVGRGKLWASGWLALGFKDRKRYIIEIYDSFSIMVISIPSGTGLNVEGGRAEGVGKGGPNIYRSIRTQAQQEDTGLLCWGQCLGKDSLRRGHFGEAWVDEEHLNRQERKGKARTPSSWYLETACVSRAGVHVCLGKTGVRLES